MNNDYNKWYEKVYPQLSNCGLWLRGNELNTLPKEEYFKRPFRVLFARLSSYADTAESFTHSLLYEAAAGEQEIYPDICYLPPQPDTLIFEKDNVPWLLGTQTKFGPEEFSLVGFSNAIIQELINIPKFLKTSKIPLKREERILREDIPLIILGGANAFFSGALWGKDSWVDAVYAGYDIAVIKEILRTCAEGVKAKKSKLEILEKLKNVRGFFGTDVFPCPAKGKKALFPCETQIQKRGIVSYADGCAGEGYLQISEGCRALCSFCAESWNRKPYSEIKTQRLLEKALAMKREMGLETINLFSFNFNMHSDFYALLWGLLPLFKHIGLKSQRFDMLADFPEMIECQQAVGKNTFSAGLEGISSRLRRYLNKNLSEENLYKSLELIFKIKARQIKIFLLSTGKEEEDDFEKFEELLNRVNRIKDKFQAATRVIFSVTPLVKFPGTPLEFEQAFPKQAHDKIIAGMRDCVHRAGFEFRLAMDTREYVFSQVLARSSDPRMISVLNHAFEAADFVYYKNISDKFFNSFLGALRRLGMREDELLSGFSFEESRDKIWAGFDTGTDREKLWEIYNKNKEFSEISADFTRQAAGKRHFCAAEFKERIREIKNREIKKDFFLNLGELARGLPRKYAGIALARAMMKAEEKLAFYFRHYYGACWEGENGAPVWISGDEIITLSWDKEAENILKGALGDKKFISRVNAYLGKWAQFRGLKTKDKVNFKLRIDSPYAFEGRDYFIKRGLKYTLYKDKEGSYSLRFTREALKKNIILGCSYSGKWLLEVLPGAKFKTQEFLKEAFKLGSKNDWVKIKVSAHMLP